MVAGEKVNGEGPKVWQSYFDIENEDNVVENAEALFASQFPNEVAETQTPTQVDRNRPDEGQVIYEVKRTRLTHAHVTLTNYSKGTGERRYVATCCTHATVHEFAKRLPGETARDLNSRQPVKAVDAHDLQRLLSRSRTNPHSYKEQQMHSMTWTQIAKMVAAEAKEISEAEDLAQGRLSRRDRDEIEAMTVDQLHEELDMVAEHISISRAEYGMGAVSMGFDPYEVAPLQTPRADAWMHALEARLAEVAPPTPPVAVIVSSDDIPF